MNAYIRDANFSEFIIIVKQFEIDNELKKSKINATMIKINVSNKVLAKDLITLLVLSDSLSLNA